MKRFIPILFTALLIAGSRGYADSLAFSLQGLSIHPDNQRELADQFYRSLDRHGNFVFTPGLAVNYDISFPNKWFTHIRFTGCYINDCAKLPSGYIGTGVLFPFINEKYYSLNICLAGGLYLRRDWRSRIENYYSLVMQKAGPVEWIIGPLPAIDLLVHPWDFQGSLLISFITVIYVSQLSAGFQFNF